ncbi:hypothetical protein RHGRI_022623 [Rhododendron griersonianum]|uniref:Uncharacterized protein n=1 Tax=Rhododendron griersonianum TaxID=479676 RepID=A0AAV6J5X5_9ERIC|nr:hypothetical protein RHGRI_022623 [Rhododendron griersonianum]
MKEPVSSKMKVAQVINGEFHKGAEAINLNLENCRLVQFGYENFGSREVYKGILECVNNSFTEVFQKEKGIVSIIAKPSEQVKDMKCHRKPELGTLENEVVRSLIGFHTSKHNPLEFTENEDDKDAHGFSSQILGSRKPQKFCLLSEILRRDGSGASAKISSSNRKTCFHDVNTKVTQAIAADDSDEPDGIGLDIASRGQIAGEENVEKDTEEEGAREDEEVPEPISREDSGKGGGARGRRKYVCNGGPVEGGEAEGDTTESKMGIGRALGDDSTADEDIKVSCKTELEL